MRTLPPRRALVRLQRAAVRLVEAVGALRPLDWAALSMTERIALSVVRRLAAFVAARLPFERPRPIRMEDTP